MSLQVMLNKAFKNKKRFLQLNGFRESYIPDYIGELRHLQEIHISGCPNLETLPETIYKLKALQKLTIIHSAITELPDSITTLPFLSYIRIDRNPLFTKLPHSVGNLNTMKHLIVTQCHLNELPESIGSLHLLQEFVIHGNCLRNLPETIVGLHSLRRLNIAGNWLQVLPESISGLQELVELELNGNYLTSLPTSIGSLKSLRIVRLDNNRLHTIPESFRSLEKLQQLNLMGNVELGLPVEVLEKEPEIIFDFFFRSASRRQLNEAKILLIGQGGVGKTSLVNRLLDGRFDENEIKTEGIQVRNWFIGDKKQIRLNVWDFGGQEIMHATHQFFLTKRSLYILVLDARAGERESNIHYWLEMISIYGAQSPVIIVLNKSEQHFDRVDENRLRLDYQQTVNFYSFHTISCKTGFGIGQLRTNIESAIKMMPHVSDYLPEDYFAVKIDLESRAENTDFLTQIEYAETCAAHGVIGRVEQNRLLRFLHDLGSVLHYDDSEQRYHVHDTRVLNPTWVTGGVYRVLNDAILLRNGNGIVTQNDLKRLLDSQRYPEHRYRFLIDIMRKYELCIEFPNEPVKVLVPELLSKNEPDVGWMQKGHKDVLDFEYHYTVLPRGLIPRFIVRAQHLLTKQQTVWRAGAVLTVEECRILVRGDLRRAKVFIQVQGLKENRRRALAVIRDAFRSVHFSYGDLNAEEKVTLPMDPLAPPVDYRHLLKLERQSIDEYFFEKANRPYNIRVLLDGIDEPRCDAFLSHNSVDKPAVRELAKLLQEQGVRYWLDEEQLRPGRHWQKEIATALQECHTILVIIGAKVLGPWEEEESVVALDYAAKGEKLVIPILLPNAIGRRQLPPQYAFLSSRTWVDFSDGFTSEKISKLTQAILDN